VAYTGNFAPKNCPSKLAPADHFNPFRRSSACITTMSIVGWVGQSYLPDTIISETRKTHTIESRKRGSWAVGSRKENARRNVRTLPHYRRKKYTGRWRRKGNVGRGEGGERRNFESWRCTNTVGAQLNEPQSWRKLWWQIQRAHTLN
jgi:hypothetical protein